MDLCHINNNNNNNINNNNLMRMMIMMMIITDNNSIYGYLLEHLFPGHVTLYKTEKRENI